MLVNVHTNLKLALSSDWSDIVISTHFYAQSIKQCGRMVFGSLRIDKGGVYSFLPLVVDTMGYTFVSLPDKTLAVVDLSCPVMDISENKPFNRAMVTTGDARFDIDWSVLCITTGGEEHEFTRLAAYAMYQDVSFNPKRINTRITMRAQLVKCRNGNPCVLLSADPVFGDEVSLESIGGPTWVQMFQAYGPGYLSGFFEIAIFTSVDGHYFADVVFLSTPVLIEFEGTVISDIVQ